MPNEKNKTPRKHRGRFSKRMKVIWNSGGSKRSLVELIAGIVVSLAAGLTVYEVLTPEPRSVIGVSLDDDWSRTKLLGEPPLVDLMATLDGEDVDLNFAVLDRFENELRIEINCADFSFLEEGSDLNGQTVSVEMKQSGSYELIVGRENPENVPVFENQVADINGRCRGGMARTSYGKRSVTVVLNSQNILHNRDARFIAHGVRMTDARAEYPWVRDPSVWTSEPSETSFGVDLTVYGLEAANNYRFDTMRIDGSGAAELLILFLSTVFGVGITLLVDGARKMTEVVLDSLGQTPAEPAIQTPAPETETSAADNDKGAGI